MVKRSDDVDLRLRDGKGCLQSQFSVPKFQKHEEWSRGKMTESRLNCVSSFSECLPVHLEHLCVNDSIGVPLFLFIKLMYLKTWDWDGLQTKCRRVPSFIFQGIQVGFNGSNSNKGPQIRLI